MNSPAEPRIYMLTLIGRPGEELILGIRALLKLALRRYGLRCGNAREIAPPQSPQPERTQAHAQAVDQRSSSGRRNRHADRQGDRGSGGEAA